MTGRGARNKGATGERELAGILTDLFGTTCYRGARMYATGRDAPDVAGLPKIHVECKRVAALALPAALRQSQADAKPDEVPVVMHRPNRSPWMVSCLLADLPRLAKTVTGLLPELEPERPVETAGRACQSDS